MPQRKKHIIEENKKEYKLKYYEARLNEMIQDQPFLVAKLGQEWFDNKREYLMDKMTYWKGFPSLAYRVKFKDGSQEFYGTHADAMRALIERGATELEVRDRTARRKKKQNPKGE